MPVKNVASLSTSVFLMYNTNEFIKTVDRLLSFKQIVWVIDNFWTKGSLQNKKKCPVAKQIEWLFYLYAVLSKRSFQTSIPQSISFFFVPRSDQSSGLLIDWIGLNFLILFDDSCPFRIIRFLPCFYRRKFFKGWRVRRVLIVCVWLNASDLAKAWWFWRGFQRRRRAIKFFLPYFIAGQTVDSL